MAQACSLGEKKGTSHPWVCRQGRGIEETMVHRHQSEPVSEGGGRFGSLADPRRAPTLKGPALL